MPFKHPSLEWKVTPGRRWWVGGPEQKPSPWRTTGKRTVPGSKCLLNLTLPQLFTRDILPNNDLLTGVCALPWKCSTSLGNSLGSWKQATALGPGNRWGDPQTTGSLLPSGHRDWAQPDQVGSGISQAPTEEYPHPSPDPPPSPKVSLGKTKDFSHCTLKGPSKAWPHGEKKTRGKKWIRAGIKPWIQQLNQNKIETKLEDSPPPKANKSSKPLEQPYIQLISWT